MIDTMIRGRAAARRTPSQACFAPEVLECRAMLAGDMLVGVFDDTNGLSVLRYDDQLQPVAGGVATSATVGGVQGVAVAPDGSFYVSLLNSGQVLHYDNAGGLIGKLGVNDVTPAPITVPGALAFGPNGNLYVADLLSAAIFQFDTSSPTQQYLASETISLGYAPGGFDFEADGDLIVGDLFIQGLNRYDADTNAHTVLVPQGAGFNPAAVLVRPDGDILIGDITLGSDPTEHHQVLLYDVSEGTYSQFINLTTPVGTGSAEGLPPQPSSLEFDLNGDLLVGLSPDHNLNGAIQRYNPLTGAFIETVISNIGTPTAIAFLPGDEPAEVPAFGRHLFYNDSKFDGNTAGAAQSDDNAIATDKVAFTGGGTAPTNAFSSYAKGINGIMVDIAGTHGTITAADFTFKVGTTSDVSTWVDAPAPVSVSVRAGEGVAGSDRVTIIWNNNAIANKWLQVIFEGNDALGGFNTNTNLATSDVFFYGNRIGDTFENSPPTIVATSAADAVAIRTNPSFGQPVTNIFDITKDGIVSAADEVAARNNGGFLTRMLEWPPAIAFAATADDGASGAIASALAQEAGASSALPEVAGPILAEPLAGLPTVREQLFAQLLEDAPERSSLVLAGADDSVDDFLSDDLAL